MKIGILGQRRSWHVQTLQDAFLRKGAVCDFLSITRIVAGIFQRPYAFTEGRILESYDALVVRSIPSGSLEQIIFRVDVLHRLENLGVKVINSATTLERSVDKYYTSSLLEDAGIPTPRTIVAERFENAMEAFLQFKDVVVKPLFGSEGKGIVRIQDEDMAYRVFKALELGNYIFYIQEFIPHRNRDIRVFLVGDEPIAGMVRESDLWKTNIARGAKAQALELTTTLKDLSIRAAKILGAFYAGVDILESEDGKLFVTEVNGIPGWHGLQSTTDINIAERIAEHVIMLTQEQR
ncbi:MAG: RimK family alpha-L-glutamate ligase [Coprothermobacterota bacterium]|nr:RimK family alpha-L-glutamate ligase [Coprothermobacterota bacterium]